MSKKRIAVISGDGIGKETMPEGVRVMEAAASKFNIDLQFDHFDFSSWDYCEKHGKMMPDNWKDLVGSRDAIYFGAVGWPAKIPDHISLWGSLIKFRREFDQYVNLRPVRLMPGVPSPLANRKPGDIDFWVVRENTEGEYSSVGGRMFPDTDREFVTQQTVMTRIGVDRLLQFAFELAQSRPQKPLPSPAKPAGLRCRSDLPPRARRPEGTGGLAEVLQVGADDNRLAEHRRLKNIVASARSDRAAHEHHIGARE